MDSLASQAPLPFGNRLDSVHFPFPDGTTECWTENSVQHHNAQLTSTFDFAKIKLDEKFRPTFGHFWRLMAHCAGKIEIFMRGRHKQPPTNEKCLKKQKAWAAMVIPIAL
jgi:hypothetical protein